MTDNIKQPSHYIANEIEPIDFIIANKLNLPIWNLYDVVNNLKSHNLITSNK